MTSPKTSCVTRDVDSTRLVPLFRSWQAIVPHHHDSDAQGCPVAVLEHPSVHHRSVQPHSPLDAAMGSRRSATRLCVCISSAESNWRKGLAQSMIAKHFGAKSSTVQRQPTKLVTHAARIDTSVRWVLSAPPHSLAPNWLTAVLR